MSPYSQELINIFFTHHKFTTFLVRFNLHLLKMSTRRINLWRVISHLEWPGQTFQQANNNNNNKYLK